jgi:hypothetical protein
VARPEPPYRIEKLLRRERGERLFSATVADGRRALVMQVVTVPERREELHDLMEELSQLSSPHLPEVIRWELRETGLLELATVDPSGVFLSQLLVAGRLPLAQALAVWDGLLGALAPLHDKGITYGLSHPDRLMFNRRAQALLPEAGLVTALSDRLGRELANSGTLFQRLFIWPDLVPPEALQGKGVSPASDIFQSAALFFRLVTGHSAFGEGMPLEIYNRMLRNQAETLVTEGAAPPGGLSELVSECLLPDPDKRPANAARLRARLTALGFKREALAEPLLRQPEVSYSSRYPGILSVHPGGDPALEEWSADRDLDSREVEKEVLLGQLEQLRAARETAPHRSRWIMWAVLAVAVLLAVVSLPLILDPTGGAPRKHPGRMPSDGDGLTHREMVWDRGASAPHPSVRSLFATVPEPLRERLARFSVPWDAPMEFLPPVLPPYRVRAASGDSEVTFEFTARNRLHSIHFGPGAGPEGARTLVVLYDASGKPRTIALTIDGKGVLQYVSVTDE